ncbi:MAG: transporter substrate-binding domain-containing protein [Clostridia bacterium]
MRRFRKMILVCLVISLLMGLQSITPTATVSAKISVPTSVKAVALSSSSIKITWKKLSGVSGYSVYRATAKSGKYLYVKSTVSISYTNTKLTSSKIYYYRLKAYKISNGKKTYSAFSSICYAKTLKATPIIRTVLKVGLDCSYPPMEYKNEKGQYAGFDVDLAKAIGAKLKLKIQFVPTAWDTIFTALKAKKFDCIISSLSITESRKSSILFTQAYISNSLVIVVKPDDSSINATTDLKDKRVGVQLYTTAEEAANKIDATSPFKILNTYDQLSEVFAALKDDKVDAIITDVIMAGDYIKKDSTSYKLSGVSFNPDPFGIGFRKDDSSLEKKVDTVITNMKKDGSLGQLSIKWFGIDIT